MSDMLENGLSAMVTGKIVNYDPLTRKYNLPKEHSAFLTRKSGVYNLAVFAQYVSLMGNVEDKIVECFHKGGGLHIQNVQNFNSYGRKKQQEFLTVN
jgi:hypothetical protein